MTYPDAISDAALDALKIATKGAVHNSAEDFAVGEMIAARRRFAENERANRREAVCRARMGR